MRKKLLNLLSICVLNILFILGVDAATLEFDAKSLITIDQNETVIIDVKLKTDSDDEDINEIRFELDYSSDLIQIQNNELSNDYLAAFSKNIAIIQNYKAGKISDGTVFSINVKNISSEDAGAVIDIKNVQINNKDVDITDTQALSLKKKETTTKIQNTSAKLTNFTVANATIKPAFSQNTKEYKIYTNKDTIQQITISPKYEQSGVSMSVECTLGCTSDAATPNKLKLIMGKNEATFTFTSEDGKNTEIYKFTIYRGETTDGSNLLADLSIEGFELNEKFDKSNLDYTLTVPYETEKLEVKATAEDENTDIQIKGADSLTVGENVITVTVTSAETSEKKIYNITVTREEFKAEEETTTEIAPVIEKQKDNNIWKIIIIIIISLLIIGLSAYFIFFKKKVKKNKKKTDIDEIDVKEKDIILNNPIIDEDKEPTSVEEALADLMKTKEMEIKD